MRPSNCQPRTVDEFGVERMSLVETVCLIMYRIISHHAERLDALQHKVDDGEEGISV